MTAGAAGELYVLSAGAAQGLVAALAPRLLADEDVTLRTTFGAVGAIREKVLAGDRCDVLILTESMIDQLTTSGHVVANSGAALGHVRTGIGVRSDDPRRIFPIGKHSSEVCVTPLTFSCPTLSVRRRVFTSCAC
jgi:ABC-type molybdate transport system substrate-binding protein